MTGTTRATGVARAGVCACVSAEDRQGLEFTLEYRLGRAGLQPVVDGAITRGRHVVLGENARRGHVAKYTGRARCVLASAPKRGVSSMASKI